MMYFGFDPGGIGAFGCALLDSANSSLSCATVLSVDEAVCWARRSIHEAPIAAGIDTLLFWQSTKSGWRGADQYLRRKYPECRNSVVSSNGLYGSMSVQGAVLAARLRQVWPEIGLTETHPKVLWHSLNGSSYPRIWSEQGGLVVQEWLAKAKLKHCEISDDHQFDAALSAWAAYSGFSGAWVRDLFIETAEGQQAENVSLVPDVKYMWPE